MTKRTGYVIGLLVIALGVGIPAVVAADNEDQRIEASLTQARDTTSVVPAWSSTLEDPDMLGADPYDRFIGPTAPSRDATSPVSALSSSLSDPDMIAIAPFDRTVEPAPRRDTMTPVSALSSSLDDPDMIGIDSTGAFVAQ